MIEWDSRMQNNHSVKILKAAIPFFDIDIGERIDLEGLLQAIRGCICVKERHVVDMLLQIFQMEHMMDMMKMMQTVQMAQQSAEEKSAQNMSDILKTMVPPEQQETFDMIFSMMSMMNAEPPVSDEQTGENSESVDI